MIIISLVSLISALLSINAQNIVPLNKRIDCHPDPFVSEENCVQRGCVYDPNLNEALSNPVCYYPPSTGYVAYDTLENNPIILKKSSNSVSCPFGQDLDELIFQADEIGSGLRITISPKGQTRYRPVVPINPLPNIVSSEKFTVVKKNESIFSFIVQRQSSGAKIWDTSIGGLLFADQFLQIVAYLPTDKIYGFGEHCHTSLRHNLSSYKTWGMWARDNDVWPDRNLYGVHPFYMGLEKDGKAHGLFLFNSNAQEVTTGPAPHLVYRTIGGQFEIFFFPGPTPEQVIQQYQQVIGTPFMPSYWALGFHISRYGYGSTKDVEKVVNRTWSNNIPFDTVWVDINYMEGFRDFTLDPENWGDFGNYTEYLHQKGMHVIMIEDPGIEVVSDSFQRAIEQNASFIEWPSFNMFPQEINNQYPLTNGTKIMLGVSRPDKHVAFPDFLDSTGDTSQWWVDEFKRFKLLVPLDGIWIDMNEPSVYDTIVYNPNSSIYQNKLPKNESLKCPLSGEGSKYDNPPYLTVSGYYNGPFLAMQTLCICAVSARGSQKFYDTHNLYGWSETVASALAQKQAIGKRGLVLTRSTFPSSGVYGGHWTGDALATWDSMRFSIITIQEFNMFGIPFMGADICGYGLAATEELCLRWQQLGAFYPFSRNHNSNRNPDHDPGVWPSVAAATRKANLFRYRHLPYLYSLFFNAYLNGGTVIRPVFFEFPNDLVTYDLSFQFMWGPALMIIPVTNENVSELTGYLPIDATWYSIYDYFYGNQMSSNYSTFPAPTDYLIPVLVKGGYIVPRQRPSVTTTLSRQNEFQLLVALDPNNGLSAKGELYWDDGETWIEDISTYNFYHFHFTFTAQEQTSTLSITSTKQASGLTLPTLDNIEIFGYPYTPNLLTAKLNGNPIKINILTSSYSPFTQILNITTANFINLNANGPVWTLTWDNQ